MARTYLRKSLKFGLMVWSIASALIIGAASAQQLPDYVLSGPMVPLLVQMPENSWLQVNTNLFSDVWTPPDLEPLDGLSTHPPSKIILAWSGFAWDSHRGDLILYGGGHANYSGNDVYRWHTSTLQWERASLPSDIWFDPVSGYQAIDGVDAAPSSAHTYKNNMYLPIVDRFLTWGGAAYNNGGPYLRVSETNPLATRFVGPYLFDPNRADGNKVGGTTGSHVTRVAPHPEIVGGDMWENRDIHLNIPAQTTSDAHVNGCADYATEGGHDVVYVAATSNGSTGLELYRYQLTALANPSLDQLAKVGIYSSAPARQTTCAYYPARKLFVQTGDNTAPFFFWDVTAAGQNNLEQQVQVGSTIASFQSWLSAQSLDISNCALEFDPLRNSFLLWCAAGAIWELHPPPVSNTASGWTITQKATPPGDIPPGDTAGTGVLGKWRYAPYYDVFVGLEDINEGHIWVYKPVGWVKPNPAGNVLPTVAITSPAAGVSIAPGTPLSLTATASDADGAIARVEFYVNGVKVGQATSPPYIVGLTPLFVGAYTVVAVAIDNVGGTTASAPVGFSVAAQLTTAILQRGLNTYTGVTDTYLDGTMPNTAQGASTQLVLDPSNYTPLVRFAIFQFEGGPVPNDAVIQSATLELYKQFYDDPVRLNALLKPWVEAQATWTGSQTGTAWSANGAAGAGTDYDVAADALVSGSFNPGWMAFDVTPRVQQWSDASSVNYGWRFAQPGPGNFKQFYSSEYSTDPTLRPKLTIVYADHSKATTSVALASSANPSIVGASVTFTASVHGSVPTGTVSFADSGVTITGCAAVAVTGAGDTRTAQCTANGLSAATHSIVATYGGDGGNNGSTSAPLLQIVSTKFASSVTLASSANPSSVGTSVTFTATVVGSAPTGIVSFFDSGVTMTGCAVVAVTGSGNTRTAQCTASGLSAATHSITATYGGDSGNSGSTSAPLLQVVTNKFASSVTLASSANPSSVGTSVTFTATIVGSAPTGIVSFFDGGVTMTGCAAVAVTGTGDTRTAQCSANGLSAATHSIVATYGGDGGNNGSTSAPLLQIVSSKFASSVTLASSANPSSVGTSVTFTATIVGSAPTGIVSFFDSGVTMTGCAVVAVTGTGDTRTAQCTASGLSAATHSITATYGGDTGNSGSTSAPLLQIVGSKFASSVTLASSANPSSVGTSVTFTATIVGSAPTGIVSFFDSGVTMTGCAVVAVTGTGNARTAQCTASALSAATHSIVASYGGDTGNSGSTSSPLLQIVNPVGPPPAAVTGAVSRKVHDAAGVFDLPLSLIPANPTTEPRIGPAQSVVFRFDKPVLSGTAAIAEGAAAVGSVTFAGNEMTVNLTGVDNQQYVTVTVNNVVAADGTTGGSGTARVGYLAGDVNQNRVVTLSDLALVNAELAQSVTASNFLMDINASGTLTLADKALTNASLATALPPP